MKYITYLKNKNLSKNTIDVYVRESKKWVEYLGNNKPNKTLFVKYLKSFAKIYRANSIRLKYSAIISYLKFQKQWRLVNEYKDIKLPTIQKINKTIVDLDEYKQIKKNIVLDSWKKKRDWIIFSILFYTGIRVSEIYKFDKKHIVNNCIQINGKGNKTRQIFIPYDLKILIGEWKRNNFAVAKNNRKLTYKQLNKIIKNIGSEYFNKHITPHSLRRSYATNLLRKNVDLKTVSVLLGHSNINTTAQYIYLNEDEISNKVKLVFNEPI